MLGQFDSLCLTATVTNGASARGEVCRSRMKLRLYLSSAPWLTSLAVIATSVISLLFVQFGPAPVQSASPLLSDLAQALAFREPSDTAILIGWWLLAAVLIVLGLSVGKLDVALDQQVPGRVSQFRIGVLLALAIIAISLLFASLTWSVDVLDLWSGIPMGGVLIGVVGAVAICAVWFSSPALSRLVSFLMVSAIAGATLPSLMQFPWAIRDEVHFRFAADELAAAAAGHFPLGDYLPQYSALLGWPVAPILKFMGGQAIFGITSWLMLLQIISLGIAVILPVLVAGRRFLAPAMAVAIAGAIATNGGQASREFGLSSSTYFIVMPLRTVLPAVLILAAFLILRRLPAKSIAGPSRRASMALVALGALMAIVVVNNPDFGGASVLGVVVATTLVAGGFAFRLKALGWEFLGGFSFVLLYTLLGAISGYEVRWEYLLVFPEFHGLVGYFSAPIASFGIHIAVAALFVIATAMGSTLLILGRRAALMRIRSEGLTLTLTGIWGLVALAYFAGRSYPSTLTGGLLFPAGMVASAFLPTVRRALRPMFRSAGQMPWHLIVGAALGITLLVGATSFWSLVRDPGFYLARANVLPGTTSDSVNPIPSLEEVLNNADPIAAEIISSGQVDQALGMSSVLALSPELPKSVSIANDPQWFGISTEIPSVFCADRARPGRYVLLEAVNAKQLSENATCVQALDFVNAVPLGEEDSDAPVLIPWR